MKRTERVKSILSGFSHYPIPMNERSTYAFEVLIYDAIEANKMYLSSMPDCYVWSLPLTVALRTPGVFQFYNWTQDNLFTIDSYSHNYGLDYILLSILSAHDNSPIHMYEDRLVESVTMGDYNYSLWQSLPRIYTHYNQMPTASAYTATIDLSNRTVLAVWIASLECDPKPLKIRRLQFDYLFNITHPLHEYIVLERKTLYTSNRGRYRFSGIFEERIRNGYMKAKVGIIPLGDVPQSKRFFDCLNLGTIPFVLSDEDHYPFENQFVDYSKVIIQCPMIECEVFQRALNLLTTQKEMNYRVGILDMQMINNIHPDNSITKGDYMWAWFWSQFFICTIKKGAQRLEHMQFIGSD